MYEYSGRGSSSKGSLSLSALGRGIYAAPGLVMCPGDAEITALQGLSFIALFPVCLKTAEMITLGWLL